MTQIVFSAFQCEVLEDQITRLREKIKTELSETKGFILKHPNGGNVTIQKNTITDWKAGPTGNFTNKVQMIEIQYNFGELSCIVETFSFGDIEQAINLFIGLGFKLIPLPVNTLSTSFNRGERTPSNSKFIQDLECGYLFSGSDETFGGWILNTFYKDVVFDDPIVYRDFRHTPRTVDAKIYLYGFLLTGKMKIEDFILKKKH